MSYAVNTGTIVYYQTSLSKLNYERNIINNQILTLLDKKTELFDEAIIIPEVTEDLSPLLMSLPLQLLAYFAANKLGREIDQPRNLAKSVTVE